MNRVELVNTVVEKCGLSTAGATRAVDAVFGAIAEALKSGGEVRLVGFGTFLVSERAASEGRNPRTGEPIQIAASRKARLKPSKALRDAINGAGAGR